MVVAGVAAATAPAAADHGGDDEFVATQGDRCVSVAVLGDGTRTVEEFYDYRSGNGSWYASYGTTHLQETGVSQVFAYHGSEGVSLVFVHDELGDGAGGGGVSMTINGLPNGTWPVMDDSYEGRADQFQYDGSSALIDWMYASNRTDGAVFRGLQMLGPNDAVRIDPAFGEDSRAHRDRGWSWVTGDLDWQVRHGPAADDRTSVEEDERLTIQRGQCQATDVSASLTAGDATAGEPVTLDARASVEGGSAVEYRWDVDGDGTVDEATASSRTAVEYDEAGTVSPSVTVVTQDGQQASATADVDVGPAEGPVARIDASEAAVDTGTSVQFDGSESAADGGIEALEWAFDDGAEASGASASHAFSEPGTYVVQLTVTSGDGSTDVATREVHVADPNGPSASLSVPNSVTVGERTTLDASGSTTASGAASYRWDVGADGSVEYETQSPRLGLAPAAVGEQSVSVTVHDDGQTDEATATFEVGEPAPVGGGGSGELSWGRWSDDAERATLQRTGGGFQLHVERGAAGDRVVGELPVGPSGSTTLLAVEVELASAVEDATTTWEPEAEPARSPQNVSARYLLEPSGDVPIRTVTYRFSIDRSAYDDELADVGVLERRAANWVALDREIRPSGSTHEVTLTSDDARPLALVTGVRGSGISGAPGAAGAQQGPGVQLAAVRAQQREVAANQPLVLTATYENTGTAAATEQATFSVSNRTVNETTVEVPEAGTASVSFEHTFEETGTYTVSVDGQQRTIRVVDEQRRPDAGTGSGFGGTRLVVVAFVGVLLSLLAIGRWTIQ